MTGSPAPAPVASTRDALLRAGVRLYERRALDSLQVLTAGAVAQEAGFHRQTFYRYWRNHGAYVDDLILWLLGRDRPAGMDAAVDLADAGVDLETFVRDLPVHDIAHVIDDREVRMRLGLALLQAITPGSGQGRGEGYYRETMERLADAYERLLASWGREPAPGFTVVDLVRAMQALGTGFAVQALATADGRQGTVVSARRAVAALIDGMTRPTGSPAGAPSGDGRRPPGA